MLKFVVLYAGFVSFEVEFSMDEGTFSSGQLLLVKGANEIGVVLREADPRMGADVPRTRFVTWRGLDQTGFDAIRNIRPRILPSLVNKFKLAGPITYLEQSLSGQTVVLERHHGAKMLSEGELQDCWAQERFWAKDVLKIFSREGPEAI